MQSQNEPNWPTFQRCSFPLASAAPENRIWKRSPQLLQLLLHICNACGLNKSLQAHAWILQNLSDSSVRSVVLHSLTALCPVRMMHCHPGTGTVKFLLSQPCLNFLRGQWLGLMDCSHSELIYFRHFLFLVWGISPSQGLYIHGTTRSRRLRITGFEPVVAVLNSVPRGKTGSRGRTDGMENISNWGMSSSSIFTAIGRKENTQFWWII